MAGSYADVPGPRIAYDRDGTSVYMIDSSNGLTAMTATQIQQLNDENYGNPSIHVYADYRLFFFFPVAMDLVGYFWSESTGDAAGVMDVSSDTTNGIDGTWTQVYSQFPMTRYSVSPGYRSSIVSISRNNVKGVRFKHPGPYYDIQPRAVHFYGTPTSSSGDRLEFWHPTSDARLGGAALDWGDTPRSSTADLTFRVKNVSSSLTANGVSVTLDAPTDTTPSVSGQHTMSISGGSFGSSVSVGNLTAGSISNVITLRRTTPSNATLSLWTARVLASATSFS